MNNIFSVAFMANTLSMTAMLILFSMAGQSHISADIGIVQAATAAMFYAFSANARNIVLATSNSTLAKSILNIRVVLLIPLMLSSFWLSSTLGGIEPFFAAIIILRRTVEWFGEVDLSERERVGDKMFALSYIGLQSILFIFAALWILMKMPFPLFGLLLWALLPMSLSMKFSWSSLSEFSKALSSVNKKIIPHFGSTLVIGVSLYVFRLLMILILGKNVSGDLFAAFAIGGVLGSLTLNAFGPSIAFNEKVNGIIKFPRSLKFILWVFFGFGLLIIGMSYLKHNVFIWSGKEIFYWKAIGFSMIGGVVMTHAQLLRNRLLIHNESHDLFGPDLLMNILIIAAIPLTYFLFGIDAVAGLSLLGSISAFIFYKSSEYAEITFKHERKYILKYFPELVAIVVLMPVFIKFDSGIFVAKELLVSGSNSMMSLPIPLSIFMAYLAIVILGFYRMVHMSLSVVFFTFILMILSTLIISDNHGDFERAKIILIIQNILPMGALVLGEMFKTEGMDIDARIERTFLYVLVALVPMQLAASWIQGNFQLVSYLYVFSIYQHMVYVPIIFVSAYLFAIFSLWHTGKYNKILFMLTGLMGVYAAASLSLIAMIFLILGTLLFATLRWYIASERLPMTVFIIACSMCGIYLFIEISTGTNYLKFTEMSVEVVSSWQLYIEEIFGGMQTLLFGHPDVLDKLKYPSTHNYYLDMIRNFGLIAVIPVLIAFGYTVRAAYMARRHFHTNFSLLGHVFVLLFLLVIDNSTQVSLRQPYSGIFTFLLWGLLIARLGNIKMLHTEQK